MTLQAEDVDVAHRQQAGIRRAVWRVAHGAAFGLHHRMLENERTRCLGVALGADLVLVGGGLELLALERTMRIMTVAAFHQSLIHPVMEGLGKRRLYVRVAAIAELWLRYLKQSRFTFESMHAVAISATHIRLAMGGTLEIGMRPGVAFQARSVYELRRRLAELKNLRYVAAAVDVRLARPVAAFASDSLAAMHERKMSMGIGLKFLGQIAVAGLASLRPDKFGIGHGSLLRCSGLLLVFARCPAGFGLAKPM